MRQSAGMSDAESGYTDSRKGTNRLHVTFVPGARRLRRGTVSSDSQEAQLRLIAKASVRLSALRADSPRRRILCALTQWFNAHSQRAAVGDRSIGDASPAVTLFTYGSILARDRHLSCFHPPSYPRGAIVWFGFAYKPPIAKVTTEHYTARSLDLRTPDQQMQAAMAAIAYSGSHTRTPTACVRRQTVAPPTAGSAPDGASQAGAANPHPARPSCSGHAR